MPDIHTSLPTLPFTYEAWMSQTSKLFLPRSRELSLLDHQIGAYLRSASGDNLISLKKAFSAWKAKRGSGDEWKDSKRDDKTHHPLTALEAALYKQGDTDAAFGVPSFMEADLVQSRLGLLYLFGRIDCRGNYFTIVTSGVLDLTSASLDFAGDMVESAKDRIGNVKTGIGILRNGIDPAAERADEARAVAHAKANTRPSGSKDVGTMSLEQMRTVDANRLLAAPIMRLADQQRTLADAIFDNFKRAWESALSVWDDKGGETLRQLCDFLTGRYLSEAVNGILGGSLTLFSSLINFVRDACDRFRVWSSGRKTQLIGGTPTSIVDGIKRAMNMAIGTDLYTTLKSGAQLGMTIASVGASTIVNLVCSIIEVLAKTAWRLFEIKRMQKFFVDARAKWDSRGTEAIHTHPLAFNSWFRGYALQLPILPALALNSNLCNNMHFLQMFPEGKTPIRQDQYQLGMAHMKVLKEWSSSYIEDAGYQLSSTDGLVGEWIKPGKREDESGVRRHLLNPVLGFFG